MSDEGHEPIARPSTVTAAAWILIVPAAILGVLSVVATVLFAIGAPRALMGGGGGFSFAAIPMMLLSIVLALVVPVGLILVGIGLLRVRSWAFAIGIGMCAFLLLVALGPILFARRFEPISSALGVLIPASVIALLMTRSSREAFADAREQQQLP